MERQLNLCHERSLECKFDPDFLDDLSDVNSSSRNQDKFVQTLQKRCVSMLKEHHEYRQLCSDSSMQDTLSNIEANINKAVIFLVAFMDRNDISTQSSLLFGPNKPQLVNQNVSSISLPKCK